LKREFIMFIKLAREFIYQNKVLLIKAMQAF